MGGEVYKLDWAERDLKMKIVFFRRKASFGNRDRLFVTKSRILRQKEAFGSVN
jgi:hypothetical protein